MFVDGTSGGPEQQSVTAYDDILLDDILVDDTTELLLCTGWKV